MNELINHGGVCRTAPATPGLLKSLNGNKKISLKFCSQPTKKTILMEGGWVLRGPLAFLSLRAPLSRVKV